MSQLGEPIKGEDGFEASVQGEGGQVPMPSVGAGSRGGRSGEAQDQQAAEDRVAGDRHRVAEGYVHPGEPHTD